ncbi:hypothetical protein J3P71_22795 [Rhizobium leguminosarum]|uniref:hypothetical protein n=1 Tax=Rhizobium leguminosarum TaxID=384 RepID=UPI0014419B88|nr:hypothetical protein [Rhizobium leguminosarum]NKM76716.1 hypothetical protein [Rhizobium leguminosarum bv. viciae]QSZ07604.1 hypothetical protein J3P71_22795 [Rhizobium leguminosarum]
MTSRKKLIACAGITTMLLVGDVLTGGVGSFISEAQARVGRPLTPVSYAGVARRTTRRAVAVGATAGAVYAPGCVQVVDAYGRVYYRCP